MSVGLKLRANDMLPPPSRVAWRWIWPQSSSEGADAVARLERIAAENRKASIKPPSGAPPKNSHRHREAEAWGQRISTENVLYYDYKGPIAPIDSLRTAAGYPISAKASGCWSCYLPTPESLA